jgi:hypothetical protein
VSINLPLADVCGPIVAALFTAQIIDLYEREGFASWPALMV